MLLKGAYCVGEHFVDPQCCLFLVMFLNVRRNAYCHRTDVFACFLVMVRNKKVGIIGHPFPAQIFLLSCHPRVTVTSCFAYKVTRNLKSIDHLCINHVHITVIDRIYTQVIYRFKLTQVKCTL